MLPTQAHTTGDRPGSRAIHLALAALVCGFLIAHLPWLVTAPGDVDEVNFVMGCATSTSRRISPTRLATRCSSPSQAGLSAVARWDGLPANHAGSAACESARAPRSGPRSCGALGLNRCSCCCAVSDAREDVALARPRSPRPRRCTGSPPAAARCRPVTRTGGGALGRRLAHHEASHGEPRRLTRRGGHVVWSPERLMLASALTAGLTAGIRSQTFWLVAPLFVFVTADLARSPRADAAPLRARLDAGRHGVGRADAGCERRTGRLPRCLFASNSAKTPALVRDAVDSAHRPRRWCRGSP